MKRLPLVILCTILLSCCCEDCMVRDNGTCCKTKICSPGEGYRFCDGTRENPGEDTCFPCPSGTGNRDSIDTREMPGVWKVCVPFDCSCNSDGNILENEEACLIGEIKICVCDRQQFFFGPDPFICEKVTDPRKIESIKRPGYELTNSETGTVEKCERGYYKSTADYSICKPHTKCLVGYQVKHNGSSSSDVVCEKIPERETTLQIPPQGDKNVRHPRDKNETHEPDHPVEGQDVSSNTGVIVTVAAVGFVVLVIITVVCVMIWKYPDKFGCFSPLIEYLKVKCGVQTATPAVADEENIPVNNEVENQENQYELVDEEQTNLLKLDPETPSDIGQSSSFGSSSDLPSYVRQGEIRDLPMPPSSASSAGDPDSGNCHHGDTHLESRESSGNCHHGDTHLESCESSGNCHHGDTHLERCESSGNCHHSDTHLESCESSVRTEPTLAERNDSGVKPVGIVAPSQRVENEVPSHGQQMTPSQGDHGVLVPTGQRVAESMPRNLQPLQNGGEQAPDC